MLYLYPQVAAATAGGEKTYSRHDTHWSGYGAYAGYVGLMNRLRVLGLTADDPRPISEFRKIDLKPNGSPRDLALMLGVSSFVHIDYPHLDNPTGEDRITKSFLSARTDWTGPQVIDTGSAGKPVLMMVRDSFSNALVPFLYPHFSRIVLTHNVDGFWRPDMIERFKPDIVILEVIEAGLRVGVGDGPQPSDAAAARIDHVLGQSAPTGQGAQRRPDPNPGRAGRPNGSDAGDRDAHRQLQHRDRHPQARPERRGHSVGLRLDVGAGRPDHLF